MQAISSHGSDSSCCRSSRGAAAALALPGCVLVGRAGRSLDAARYPRPVRRQGTLRRILDVARTHPDQHPGRAPQTPRTCRPHREHAIQPASTALRLPPDRAWAGARPCRRCDRAMGPRAISWNTARPSTGVPRRGFLELVAGANCREVALKLGLRGVIQTAGEADTAHAQLAQAGRAGRAAKTRDDVDRAANAVDQGGNRTLVCRADRENAVSAG